MIHKVLALLALLALAFAGHKEAENEVQSWSLDFAKRTVWFSAAAYCSKGA
jgi:hypothetical protein